MSTAISLGAGIVCDRSQLRPELVGVGLLASISFSGGHEIAYGFLKLGEEHFSYFWRKVSVYSYVSFLHGFWREVARSLQSPLPQRSEKIQSSS